MKRRAYADPYVAGVALGLVLLSAFAFTGQGLGASGAFVDLAAQTTALANPKAAASNPYFASYMAQGAPWTVWMVVEVTGIVIGGLLSAALAGRLRRPGEGPPTPRSRLMAAGAGGALMGVGAVLARGCTSGQALSGGALLSVGSWLFMAVLFATGFVIAPLVRRLWT